MLRGDFCSSFWRGVDLAVSQNLRYLFGVGYHPTIVFFKGFLGVHRGTGVLTHCHLEQLLFFFFFWGGGSFFCWSSSYLDVSRSKVQLFRVFFVLFLRVFQGFSRLPHGNLLALPCFAGVLESP